MGLETYILISAPLTIPALVGFGYLTQAVFGIDNCTCDTNVLKDSLSSLLLTLPSNVFANNSPALAIKSIPPISNSITTSDKRIKLSDTLLGLSKMALVVLWMCVSIILLYYIRKIIK